MKVHSLVSDRKEMFHLFPVWRCCCCCSAIRRLDIVQSIQKTTTQCETKPSLCYILIKLVDLMSDRWLKMVFVLICCETDTVVGMGGEGYIFCWFNGFRSAGNGVPITETTIWRGHALLVQL
jgi:hypothetical protein